MHEYVVEDWNIFSSIRPRIKFLHQLNFSQHLYSFVLPLIEVRDALDCHRFLTLITIGFGNRAKWAGPQHVHRQVPPIPKYWLKHHLLILSQEARRHPLVRFAHFSRATQPRMRFCNQVIKFNLLIDWVARRKEMQLLLELWRYALNLLVARDGMRQFGPVLLWWLFAEMLSLFDVLAAFIFKILKYCALIPHSIDLLSNLWTNVMLLFSALVCSERFCYFLVINRILPGQSHCSILLNMTLLVPKIILIARPNLSLIDRLT